MRTAIAATGSAFLLLSWGFAALAQEGDSLEDGTGGQPYADQLPQEPPQAEAQPAVPAAQPGDQQADFETFRDALSPYGQWVENQEYGQVWVPGGVEADWRPYSDGQWQYTAYGWTWVGAEPWAWGPYHYGRWFFYEGVGWSWAPGYTWGPAWVSWRYGPGFVGWTPLAPGWAYGGPWLPGYGVDYNRWNFVGYDHFWGGPLRGQLYGADFIRSTVWGATRPIGAWSDRGATFVGPSREFVEQRYGRPITPMAIHPVASVSLTGVRGHGVNLFAPRFSGSAHPFAAANGRIQAEVSPLQRVGVSRMLNASGTGVRPYRPTANAFGPGRNGWAGSNYGTPSYRQPAPSTYGGSYRYAPGYGGNYRPGPYYDGTYAGPRGYNGLYRAAPAYGPGGYRAVPPPGYRPPLQSVPVRRPTNGGSVRPSAGKRYR